MFTTLIVVNKTPHLVHVDHSERLYPRQSLRIVPVSNIPSQTSEYRRPKHPHPSSVFHRLPA